LLGILLSFIGYKSFKAEDKKKAKIFIYGSMFLALQIFITACFDIVQILDSKDDNEFFCGLKGQFSIDPSVELKFFECSFFRYYLTIFFTILGGVSMVISAFFTNQWKLILPNISDNL